MTRISSFEQLANVVRANPDVCSKICERMKEISYYKNAIELLIKKNTKLVDDRLARLGVLENPSAKEVFDALISKIEADDHNFFEALGRPNLSYGPDCHEVLLKMKRFLKPPVGFVLKEKKAKEFLMKEPPKKVLEFLNYSDVSEMIEKENLYEVYSSLRFVEGNEWLNTVFFKQYESLTPDDFEEREIRIQVLSEKWNTVAKHFVEKKWHNISHLKEMGVVFVIPVSLGISGELLRMISLVFHYLHEIPFYSKIIRSLTSDPSTFADKFISLLRGDVPNIPAQPFPDKKVEWLVVQRYLAKDNDHDPHLSFPHISPEALHWEQATHDIVEFSKTLDGFSHEMAFWEGLDWVGDYFKDENGKEILVSFNLVDMVMSLVMEKYVIKYLYHQEEAMWNQIFREFMGDKVLYDYSGKYLLEGKFEV